MELTAVKYKQTEVGLIPEDWTSNLVGDCFLIHNNLRLPLSRDVRKSMQGIYPYYGPTKIQDYINQYRVNGKYALICEDGDHFLKWDKDSMTQLVTGRFNVNNHAHLLKGDNKETTTEWFYYFFKHRDITSYLARQGAGRYKLSKGALVTLPCAYPNIDEQKAIAEVLNDTDNLIKSLEKKIIKKNLIKEGVVSNLLTPRENWEERTLGEVCSIFTGKKDVNEGSPNGSYPFFTCSKKHSFSDSYSFEGKAIMIAGNGEVGHLQFYDGKFEAYQRTYVLQDFQVNARFLWIELNANFKKSLGIGTIGSTIPYIKKENIFDYKYSCPKDVQEQLNIARVISDMTREINLLEQKLSKYKLAKQGVMQQLLTGKIRLV